MSQTYVLKFAIFVVQGFHNDLHFCNAVVLFYQDRTHKFRDQTESRMTWDVQNWALFLVWKTAKTASALCPKNKPGVALSSYNFPQQIWFVKYERSWRTPHSFFLAFSWTWYYMENFKCILILNQTLLFIQHIWTTPNNILIENIFLKRNIFSFVNSHTFLVWIQTNCIYCGPNHLLQMWKTRTCRVFRQTLPNVEIS